MLWKVYFWIFTVLTIIGLLVYVSRVSEWNVADWLEFTSSILGIVGLYAFVFKKKILSQQVWKVFFWIIIISWGLNILLGLTPLGEIIQLPKWLESQMVTDTNTMLLSILLAGPMAYAIYKLGYNKK